SLYEIAIMTRAAPAKLIGLADRGHLAPGAAADIVVYKEDADRERMFEKPELVFKDGELVVRDGRIVKVVRGNTHAVKPEFDRSIEKKIEPYFQRYHSVRMNNFKISDDELCECGGGSKL
ncbi:amidohydrolase family protein, partial [Salmonella enterica subsp. enterica serovar Typhimurium]|nr:amidohydrolase family protein [Salmonella enterica subsp. enterica serovar Typhimurium]